MRRRWGLVAVVVVAALVVGACSGGGKAKVSISPTGSSTTAVSSTGPSDETGDVEALRPKAAKVTDQMGAEQWGAIRAQFDDDMKKSLAEDGMAGVWASVLKQNGAYRSHGDPKQNASVTAGLTVFDTPMTFEHGQAKTRVAFHADGSIAGLFVLPTEAP